MNNACYSKANSLQNYFWQAEQDCSSKTAGRTSLLSLCCSMCTLSAVDAALFLTSALDVNVQLGQDILGKYKLRQTHMVLVAHSVQSVWS